MLSKMFFVAVIGFLCFYSASLAENSDLVLTSSQKKALDEFKLAIPNPLPHSYMNHDAYLVKWLRAKQFNVNDAVVMLTENLKWREKNRMDTILDEYWLDMEESYPFSLDTRDKDGRPIYIAVFGEWDLRKAEVTGKFPRVLRYGLRLLEQEFTIIRTLQMEGKNITRVILFYDMDGFNVIQHACPSCLAYLPRFYEAMEEHYPCHVEKIFLVNTPPTFHIVFQSITGILSQNIRQRMEIHGRNVQKYSKSLLKYIDKSQLAKKYGGSKGP